MSIAVTYSAICICRYGQMSDSKPQEAISVILTQVHNADVNVSVAALSSIGLLVELVCAWSLYWVVGALVLLWSVLLGVWGYYGVGIWSVFVSGWGKFGCIICCIKPLWNVLLGAGSYGRCYGMCYGTRGYGTHRIRCRGKRIRDGVHGVYRVCFF